MDRDALAQEFEALTAAAEWHPLDFQPGPLERCYTFHTGRQDEDQVVFRGTRAETFDSFCRSYARHALGHDGLSVESVRTHAVSALVKARSDGVDAALDWLEAQLEQPPRPFLVAAEQRHRFHPDRSGGRVHLGVVEWRPDFPDEIERVASWPRHPVEPPVAVARVTASDTQSAVVLGLDKLDEAESVVDAIGCIASSRPHLSGELVIRELDSEAISVWSAGPTGLTVTQLYMSTEGRWLEGFQELADALGKPPAARTDLERRAISTCRWLSHARRSVWTAEKLAMLMSALESALIWEGGRGKGQKIAVRATSLVRISGIGEARQQRKMIERLYKRRNDAVHAGLSVEDDLDVTRLTAIVDVVAWWLMHHLSPRHRHPEALCTSVQEALESPHDPPHNWP